MADSKRGAIYTRRNNHYSHSSYADPSNYYQHKGNVQKVWETASVINGRDPDKYRMDASKTIIHRDQYGKADHQGGWDIDHMVSQSKGGSDFIKNLQALNSHTNRGYGNNDADKPKRI